MGQLEVIAHDPFEPHTNTYRASAKKGMMTSPSPESPGALSLTIP